MILLYYLSCRIPYNLSIKIINFNVAYSPYCLYHLIDEENFFIVDPNNKQFKLINIKADKIIKKVEFQIEHVNKISSFFVTKNNYLAFLDDEEKVIHVFTDGSFKIKPSKEIEKNITEDESDDESEAK